MLFHLTIITLKVATLINDTQTSAASYSKNASCSVLGSQLASPGLVGNQVSERVMTALLPQSTYPPNDPWCDLRTAELGKGPPVPAFLSRFQYGLQSLPDCKAACSSSAHFVPRFASAQSFASLRPCNPLLSAPVADIERKFFYGLSCPKSQSTDRSQP